MLAIFPIIPLGFSNAPFLFSFCINYPIAPVLLAHEAVLTLCVIVKFFNHLVFTV